jgi:hypothetical protein
MPDLSQLPLRDIHLPGPVPWWPPAPGWWLLAALLAAGAVILGLYYRRRRHRRAALKAMRGLAAALGQGAEPVICLQRLSSVLRRFAITAAGHRISVAGLTGRRWLEYLDSQWDRDDFSHGPGEALIDAPYARPDAVSRQRALALIAMCVAWVEVQRPDTARADGRAAGAQTRAGAQARWLPGLGLLGSLGRRSVSRS